MRRAIVSVLLAAVCLIAGMYGAAASRPADPSLELYPSIEGIIPPVTVSHANRTLDLAPWSWCWAGGFGCIEGMVPAKIPYLDVLHGPVTVEFPRDDWEFSASFVRIAGKPVDVYNCETVTLSADVEQIDEQTWQFSPRGPAGSYRVDVHGDDPEGADVSASFIATTTTDHPWPPSGGQAIVTAEATPTGKFRFIVSLYRLPATRHQTTADIILVGADGEHTVTANVPPSNEPCDVGFVDIRQTLRAAPIMKKLGDPPYDIRYEVVLDGTLHVATTGWPPYEDPPYYGLEYTPLEFEPALPFGPAPGAN